jgi:long-subunit fatty acid transport protein
VSGVAVMLPFMGMTEIPVLAAGLGNFTIENPGRNLTFGTGVYAPIMLGLQREDDDPGVFSARKVGITRLTYFAPTVGLKLTDKLSVGAGIQFSYFGVGLDFDMRFPNLVLGSFDTLQQANCNDGSTNIVENIVCGDGDGDGITDGRLDPFGPLASVEAELEQYLSASYSVGLLWEAYPWLTLGMTYMSGSRDRLEGEVNIRYSDAVRGFVNSLANNPEIGFLVRTIGVPGELTNDQTDASVVISYPQHLALGASVQVTQALKTNVDIKWTDTAVWDIWEIRFEDKIELLGVLGTIVDVLDQGTTGGDISANGLYLPRGYQSLWSWAIGFEYQYDDRLVLRAGYEPRGSSIPRDKADLIVPLGKTYLYSAGLGYRWSKDTTIDAALAYITSEQNIPANGSTNSTSTAIDNFIYNPYAGYNMTTSVSVVVGEISIRSTF